MISDSALSAKAYFTVNTIIIVIIVSLIQHQLFYKCDEQQVEKAWQGKEVHDGICGLVSKLILIIYHIVYGWLDVPSGHFTQSLVRRTPDPWQDRPPLLGGGFVQVLVLSLPEDRVAPGQRQSFHVDHDDQPPFTDLKNRDKHYCNMLTIQVFCLKIIIIFENDKN